MQNSDELRQGAPTLPKGGGSLTGLNGTLSAIGPDGAAGLTLPLPISAGRGEAPTLALHYSSHSGNGAFGMGWDLSLPRISRRTREGVPTYQDSDEFVGPDGEVLVQVSHDAGARFRDTLLDIALGAEFAVTTYRSRIEQDFGRFEYWSSREGNAEDFWVQYAPDGHIALLGKNPHARLSNPENPEQTAQWLLESSVSVTGEQCYYRYRAEDDAGSTPTEISAHPSAFAQRYLTAVYYGNLTAGRELPGLRTNALSAEDWLFCLVLDYGERSLALSDIPPFASLGDWLCRQDSFSRYEYGFEVRTRRLCRQVMMFHRLKTLAGQTLDDETPTLVNRLLLEYEETPTVSLLTAARQVAYEPDEDGTLRTLPPLEFGWQTFSPPAQPDWQVCHDLQNLNAQHPYQLIDLHGEGVAGVLYQDQGAWWYRAPLRQSSSDDKEAITWAAATPLPSIPSQQQGAMLLDLRSEGRPQWVVTHSGVAGVYDQTVSGGWQHFAPLQALPVEYGHPRAKLAGMLGNGRVDVVMIGPRSVRLYAGTGAGWQPAQTVLQSAGVILPIPDADPQTLVAFGDPLGSGQPHLVQVCSNGVTCWPNLGQGRFGAPIDIDGFSQPATTFNPQQIYLADIDGSGTTDLIYAHADRLEIYLNQSGNRFAAPFSVTFPDGVAYDRTCQLQVADIQGLGVASLLLSRPHPTPQHWVCHLTLTKPWLLNVMNNNMGAQHNLHYRSAAQFWLDEKALRQSQGDVAPASYQPLPLHLLWRNEWQDEVTGNKVVSEARYRHGVWDSREREFRGFGYVEVQDSELMTSHGTGEGRTLPTLTRQWFSTGFSIVDKRLPDEYWQADEQAFGPFFPRLTIGEGEEESVYTPEDNEVFWLNRAMKGMLLRSEVYGMDESAQASVPYTVTENRLQVRLIETDGPSVVAWPSSAESRTYTYERIINDPQCQQLIVLASDAYGQPLRQVTVNYPRRAKPATSPYPDSIPPTLFDSSYDEQQAMLRLTLQQYSWHHQIDTDNGIRVLGLPDRSRGDAFTYADARLPVAGVTLESLQDSGSLIADSQPYAFIGQQQIWYQGIQGIPTTESPTPQALVAFTDIAIFDEDIVLSLSDSITTDQLTAAGYQQSDYLFARPGESLLWTARLGHTVYDSAAHFWRPVAFRETALTGASTLTWDLHHCVVTGHQDAAGLTTSAHYDYRFLIPNQLTDVNDNVSVLTLDALGRVTSSRFWGTEAGRDIGYSQLPITLPENIDQALQLTAPLPVASCQVYVPDSWMPVVSQIQLTRAGLTHTDALTQRILTEDGRLRALAGIRNGPSSLSTPLRRLLAETSRLPPHGLALVTDRYDCDSQQQIRQQVTFSDGFGRVLQMAVRHEAGNAWQRNEDGSLNVDEMGGLLNDATNFRWAVTGRTEYDNKGQPIRTYQPYFLNDWRYVSDDSARRDLHADTHCYDPLGREWQVITAKGWLRRAQFTPWFVVSEDENDTLVTDGNTE